MPRLKGIILRVVVPERSRVPVHREQTVLLICEVVKYFLLSVTPSLHRKSLHSPTIV